MEGVDSPMFLAFVLAWFCFTVCGAYIVFRGEPYEIFGGDRAGSSYLTEPDTRLKLALGMHVTAAVFGLSALVVALNLHQWFASNGDQVASAAKIVGKFMLALSGLVAMTVAVLSNVSRRTRFALAAYSLAMLASWPVIQHL